MGAPMTNIYVCAGVRLTNDYKHTIYFESPQAQRAYFNGKRVYSFYNYAYCRKNWTIKLNVNREQAVSWSYLYYNNGVVDRNYYYFITDIEYINDNCVELSLELDVMQTYHFDYQLMPCFVDREHCLTDTIGDNTIDEGLDIGELAICGTSDISLADMYIMVMSTFSLQSDGTVNILSSSQNGVFAGVGVYAVNSGDYGALGQMLKLYDDNGVSEGVLSIWMYPKNLVNTVADPDGVDTVAKQVSGATSFYHNIAINTSLAGGYVPRNKKLYTYPYNFLYVTNNQGGSGVYRYERFADPNFCNFRVVGAITPEGAVSLHPLNYNGDSQNYDCGITLSGFPTCAWQSDTYKLWLAQNQSSQNLNLATSGLTIAGGLAGVASAPFTGGAGVVAGVGAITHGATSIANIMAQRADRDIQPPQAKGQHSASVNLNAGFLKFTLQRKSLSYEQCHIIDSYFDTYGYKINRCKVPNRKVREEYTYTRTIGCQIVGDFCVSDKAKIQTIYDNGITFWVNGDHIGQYDLQNLPLG